MLLRRLASFCFCLLAPAVGFTHTTILKRAPLFVAPLRDSDQYLSEATSTKNETISGAVGEKARLSTELNSYIWQLLQGKEGGLKRFIAREYEWGEKRLTVLAQQRVDRFRRFVAREVEWGESVTSALKSQRRLSELTEGRFRRLRQFVAREVEWGDTVRSKFVDKEVVRDEQYNRALGAFLERNRADLTKIAERAVSDELTVREAASVFLDAELSKVFPVLDICTDGLYCGRNGGLDLFEAVCAFQYALGLDSVLVRPAHCESVCPREGGVAVKCPDSRARVCAAPEDHVLVKSVSTAAVGMPSNLEQTNQNNHTLQSQQGTALAAAVLMDTATPGLTEAGRAMAAEIASLLLPEDSGLLMDEISTGSDEEGDWSASQEGILAEGVGRHPEPESEKRGDFSRRSRRVAKSWSVVAARLVALECSQQRLPSPAVAIGGGVLTGRKSELGSSKAGCFVAGPGVVSGNSEKFEVGSQAVVSGGGVPLELVLAHRAKHFGDQASVRRDWERAQALYDFAVRHAPPNVFEPTQLNEEEAFQAAELAKRKWAGSIWLETGRQQQQQLPCRPAGRNSKSAEAAPTKELSGTVLTFPAANAFEATLNEGGGYGSCNQGGGEVGTLGLLVSREDGIIEGKWLESSSLASGDVGADEAEGGRREGRFHLKMSEDGHSFLGERFDDKGASLGLWHGYRLLPSGPLASPPPMRIDWIYGALVGRARASLELYFLRERTIVGLQPPSSRGGGEVHESTFARDEQQLKKQGDFLASVVTDCQEAVSLWPRGPESLAVLVIAKEEQGDLTGAIEVLEELLFLQPPAPANVCDSRDLAALRDRSPEAASAAAAAADALTQASYSDDVSSRSLNPEDPPRALQRASCRHHRALDLWELLTARRKANESGGQFQEEWQGDWEAHIHKQRLVWQGLRL